MCHLSYSTSSGRWIWFKRWINLLSTTLFRTTTIILWSAYQWKNVRNWNRKSFDWKWIFGWFGILYITYTEYNHINSFNEYKYNRNNQSGKTNTKKKGTSTSSSSTWWTYLLIRSFPNSFTIIIQSRYVFSIKSFLLLWEWLTDIFNEVRISLQQFKWGLETTAVQSIRYGYDTSIFMCNTFQVTTFLQHKNILFFSLSSSWKWWNIICIDIGFIVLCRWKWSWRK